MEYISVFDMLKIGVGPSSSHTLGPWRAAEAWINSLRESNDIDQINQIEIDLYGSLSLTGKGHATDLAIINGLEGFSPETVDPKKMLPRIKQLMKQRGIKTQSP